MNTCVEAVAPSEVNLGCLPAVTQQALTKRGISTIGQLRQIPKPVLMTVFGEATGRELWELARGRDAKKAGPSKPNSLFRRSASPTGGEPGWVEHLGLQVRTKLEALDRALETIWGVPTEEVPRRTTPAP